MEPPDKDDDREKALDDVEREVQKLAADMGASLETPRQPDEPPLCSFCGIGRNNVKFMFSGKFEGNGSPVFICADCIEAARDMMSG